MKILIIGAGVLGSNLAHSIKKDNNITIKDINDKLLMNIDGKDIIYLKDNYFAVKNKNKKYYICKVLLDEQAK